MTIKGWARRRRPAQQARPTRPQQQARVVLVLNNDSGFGPYVRRGLYQS